MPALWRILIWSEKDLIRGMILYRVDDMPPANGGGVTYQIRGYGFEENSSNGCSAA